MENVSKEQSSDEDKNLAKGKQHTEQDKPDEKRIKTVVPDNDSGKPGPPAESSSGKK